MKPQMNINSRDYDEKAFTCWHKNKLYRLSSSCYDCRTAGEMMQPQNIIDIQPSNTFPIPDETTRGDSLYNLITIERDEET